MCSPNDNVRLILVKIITTVATRCQILRLKFTKFDFSLDCSLRECSPDPLQLALRDLRVSGRRGREGRDRRKAEGEAKGDRLCSSKKS